MSTSEVCSPGPGVANNWGTIGCSFGGGWGGGGAPVPLSSPCRGGNNAPQTGVGLGRRIQLTGAVISNLAPKAIGGLCGRWASYERHRSDGRQVVFGRQRHPRAWHRASPRMKVVHGPNVTPPPPHKNGPVASLHSPLYHVWHAAHNVPLDASNVGCPVHCCASLWVAAGIDERQAPCRW